LWKPCLTPRYEPLQNRLYSSSAIP
jgi:hypothetical protein